MPLRLTTFSWPKIVVFVSAAAFHIYGCLAHLTPLLEDRNFSRRHAEQMAMLYGFVVPLWLVGWFVLLFLRWDADMHPRPRHFFRLVGSMLILLSAAGTIGIATLAEKFPEFLR